YDSGQSRSAAVSHFGSMRNDVNGSVCLQPNKHVRMKRCTIHGGICQLGRTHAFRKKSNTENEGSPRKRAFYEAPAADILNATHVTPPVFVATFRHPNRWSWIPWHVHGMSAATAAQQFRRPTPSYAAGIVTACAG